MKRSRESLNLTARLALLTLVAGGLAAAAFAVPGTGTGTGPGEGDADGERHVIRLEKRIDCEGDDCPTAGEAHKMIFVNEDGEVHELEGGPGMHWIAGGHHGMLHGGKGGFLGVMPTPMTPELRLHQGAPEAAGVLVSKVVEESPAWRAGVQVGDVISAVDGEAVASPHDLMHAIRGKKSGETVTLEVWRGGTVQTLTAAVEEREGHFGQGPHAGHGGPTAHRIEIRCEGGDCESTHGSFEPNNCGGAEECEVKVRCTGDGCDCTVNGETADCAMIPGPHNDR